MEENLLLMVYNFRGVWNGWRYWKGEGLVLDRTVVMFFFRKERRKKGRV